MLQHLLKRSNAEEMIVSLQGQWSIMRPGSGISSSFANLYWLLLFGMLQYVRAIWCMTFACD